MEVKREKLAIAPAGTDLSNEDFRIRQLRARDMLRGDLEGEELEKHVEEQVVTTTLGYVVDSRLPTASYAYVVIPVVAVTLASRFNAS